MLHLHYQNAETGSKLNPIFKIPDPPLQSHLFALGVSILKGRKTAPVVFLGEINAWSPIIICPHYDVYMLAPKFI